MPEYNTRTELRLQLLKNGYAPIANKDKACYLEDWPRLDVDEKLIKRWGRSRSTLATGIRVEGGLCVIDVDVDHKVIDRVIDVMCDEVVDIDIERLTRFGKGYKLALYVRCHELFTRLHTRRWTAPDTAETDERNHCIEIFGGASARQFGSFGPHTIGEDGAIEVEYEWFKESPLDVPLVDLPVVTKAQLFAMLDAAEALLLDEGFEPVARSTSGEGSPAKIYDLTDDMTFELQDRPHDEAVTLDELTDMVEGGYTGRCSASWMGDISPNRTRCIIGTNHQGQLTLWETSTGETHMRAADGPTPRDALLEKLHHGLSDIVQGLPLEAQRRINEAQARGEDISVERDDEPNAWDDDEEDDAYAGVEAPRGGIDYAERPDLRLKTRDDMDTKVGKLLSAYGFLEGSAKPVIPLWRYEGQATDLAMSVTSLREACMPFREEGEPGPRGGKPPMINPADLWLCSVRKTQVYGARVRVDKNLPTYVEHDGTTWVNAYCPVELGSSEGGDVTSILDFIDHLIPDERERKWFMQWLAYKFQNPAIPGPAVVMVAREYGTGRGTLTKLITKLFGIRMVARVDFARYAGMNYQSQYTSWACGKLFAVVDESPAANGEVSSYQARANIYERLKEVIEPAPTLREYVFKGMTDQETVQVSNMTSLIMTNNANAIPLPEKDRRVAVISNGAIGGVNFWAVVQASIDNAPDVAAFADYLDDYDTSKYNPYAPPIMTEGKRIMTELNKTSLDKCIEEALDKMAGPFTMDQAITHIARYSSVQGMKMPDAWKAIAEREIGTRVYPVKDKKSRHTSRMVGGRTCYIYAKTKDEADTLKELGLIRYRDNIDDNDNRPLGEGSAEDVKTSSKSPVVVSLRKLTKKVK